jgi:hypothetical protein
LNGWTKAGPSWAVSLVFLVAWVVISANGGWLFTRDQEQAAGGWGFGLYYGLIVVCIVGFLVALYAISNAEGKRHLRGGVWIVAALTVTLGLSYVGPYGPLESPILQSGPDLLLMLLVSIGIYLWAVRSGGPTEELNEILAANNLPSSQEQQRQYQS